MLKPWQLKKLAEIEAVITECKTQLSVNFTVPSNQILGYYGSKLGISEREMLDAIYRHNERTAAARG